MTPLAAVALALAVAAPPPKPVPYLGRLLLWVGDKAETFRPDGGDLTPLPLPNVVNQGRGSATLTPDRKHLLQLESSRGANGQSNSRLAVTPFAADAKSFTLDGYVLLRMIPSADRGKVFFTGAKGDDYEPDKYYELPAFVLDLATKKVDPVPLPEKHTLDAVAPDGKTFITSRVTFETNSVKRNTYLTPVGGKPVEILKENVFTSQLAFSPDGSRVVMRTNEYTDLQPAGNGRFRVGGTKPYEYLLLDTTARTTKPVRDMPTDGYVYSLSWSPDGTQLAYAWYDPRSGVPGPIVPAPGGGRMQTMEYDYKVFVADADGGSPKKVYTTKGSTFRTFMWK
jgi:dipeptidyl aminopeptidase/acylaminoacyl peptidase